ncbi:MAG: YicC family protein [Clostridiales bacterium]|nr:YicC family protein [Clostridiales bacterium]
MVKSMTGFGRYEAVDDTRHMIVEIKSVNHRYCEISTKLPKKLYCFDSYIRQLVKQYCDRGKIDIFITYTDDAAGTGNIKYNPELAKEYTMYLNRLKEDTGINDEISLGLLARMPEVITLSDESEDPEQLKDLLTEAVTKALENFVEARRTEGEHLKNNIFDKISSLENILSGIEKRFPEMMADYRTKLENKLKEVIEDTKVSEQTIAAELIIYADKICVDEETVRLRAHFNNVRDTLDKGENVGRRLDFLAQEMNREANTILSKANDITVSNIAIDIKTEIEKIREQIQNIE